MVFSLIIPLSASLIFRFIISKKIDDKIFDEKISSKACDYQGYFLNIAIVAMFASQGKILLDNINILFILLVPVLLFFLINFLIGILVGKRMKFNYEDGVALNLTTLARNSPIALAIAVATFPDRPLISLALIIGPLIELPILFLISNTLLKIKDKYVDYKNII